MVWALPLATTELSPRSLTTVCTPWYSEFDWFVGLSAITNHPVLYPHRLNVRASRKTISERTSYYQIRLAFHSLPQLIRGCWTTHRFGPPFRFRGTSTWPRQAHLASGLYCTVIIRPIKTRFRYAFALFVLTQTIQDKSLAHSSIGTP